MPVVVDGIKQTPLAGVSMVSSFDNASAPTQKKVQYYEMLGPRGIWKDGWMATTVHGPVPSNIGNFDKDKWELYHTDVDRSQSTDLAKKYPEKVDEMKKLWLEEAQKYDVLPLNDLGMLGIAALEYHAPIPKSGQFTYYPGTSEVPEATAAPTKGRSFKILSEVTLKQGSKGVIVAQGSRFGGYSLFLKDGKVNFVYNFLGIPPEQVLTCAAPTSGDHIIGVEFTKERMTEKNEVIGTMKLYVDGKMMEQAQFRTQPIRYSLGGDGLSIGYDSGDPVSKSYGYKYPFTGGEIHKVVFDVADDAYINVEQEFENKMRTQ